MTYVSFCVLANSLVSPESRKSHLGQLFVLRFAFAKRAHVCSVGENAETHIRHSPFAISRQSVRHPDLSEFHLEQLFVIRFTFPNGRHVARIENIANGL